MDDSIEKVMMEEHKRIKNMLRSFENLVHINFIGAKSEFSRFKWNLEKHFFVEEKAIFSISDKLAGQEVSDIFDLMQEHGSLIELINNIENGLKNNITPNVRGLVSILNRHADFEDSVFYPKLDKILNQEQKQEIIERINEVIRG